MGYRHLLASSWTGVAAAVSLAALSWPAAATNRGDEREARVRPRLVWHVEAQGRGTPAVAGRLAVFLSLHHRVVAVDVITGRVQWTGGTGGGGDATFGSRVVTTGSLFVAGDGDLVAFDPEGHMRWRFAPEDAFGTGTYLGTATNDTVFAGSAAGRLFAIDARTGRPRWTATAPASGPTTVFAPVLAGDLVIAGFTTFNAPPAGGLLAVEAATGAMRWTLRFAPGPYGVAGYAGGPAVAGRVVAATGQDGRIVMADRETGRVIRVLDAVGEPIVSRLPPVEQDYRALVVAGDVLVAGSLTGTVVAWDAASGQERWRQRFAPASVAFDLAASRTGAVYVPYLSGELVCVDAATGLERWRTDDAPLFSWAPAVVGSRVYAAGSSAGFVALADPVAPDLLDPGALDPRSRTREEER